MLPLDGKDPVYLPLRFFVLEFISIFNYNYALFGSINLKKILTILTFWKKIRTKVARACFDQYSVISVLNWILPLLYLTVFLKICLIKILSSLEINVRKVLFVKTRNLCTPEIVSLPVQQSADGDEITRENVWSQTISKKFEIQKKLWNEKDNAKTLGISWPGPHEKDQELVFWTYGDRGWQIPKKTWAFFGFRTVRKVQSGP